MFQLFESLSNSSLYYKEDFVFCVAITKCICLVLFLCEFLIRQWVNSREFYGLEIHKKINPTNVNPIKWSNTLKQFVWIVWVCLTNFRGWRLKRWQRKLSNLRMPNCKAIIWLLVIHYRFCYIVMIDDKEVSESNRQFLQNWYTKKEEQKQKKCIKEQAESYDFTPSARDPDRLHIQYPYPYDSIYKLQNSASHQPTSNKHVTKNQQQFNQILARANTLPPLDSREQRPR